MVLAIGYARDGGIEVPGKRKLLKYTEFEQHAGSSNHRPCQYTYGQTGRNLQVSYQKAVIQGFNSHNMQLLSRFIRIEVCLAQDLYSNAPVEGGELPAGKRTQEHWELPRLQVRAAPSSNVVWARLLREHKSQCCALVGTTAATKLQGLARKALKWLTPQGCRLVLALYRDKILWQVLWLA